MVWCWTNMVIKQVRLVRLIRPSVLDKTESINVSAPENNCPERTWQGLEAVIIRNKQPEQNRYHFTNSVTSLLGLLQKNNSHFLILTEYFPYIFFCSIYMHDVFTGIRSHTIIKQTNKNFSILIKIFILNDFSEFNLHSFSHSPLLSYQCDRAYKIEYLFDSYYSCKLCL